MTCTHLRQWVPLEPGDSQMLPCAWPGCDEGVKADGVMVPEAPSHVFTTHDFLRMLRLSLDKPIRTASYTRERTVDEVNGWLGWRWIGPADPFPWVTT